MAKALAKAQPRKNDPDATRENILDIAARELLLLTGNQFVGLIYSNSERIGHPLIFFSRLERGRALIMGNVETTIWMRNTQCIGCCAFQRNMSASARRIEWLEISKIPP